MLAFSPSDPHPLPEPHPQLHYSIYISMAVNPSTQVRLEPFQGEIYALQLHLSRAVTVAQAANTSGCVDAVRLRRLGPLLMAARQLQERVHAQGSDGLLPIPTGCTDDDDPTLQFRAQRLPAVYEALCAAAAAAQEMLVAARAESKSLLPLSCVGAVPRQQEPAAGAHGSTISVLVAPSAADGGGQALPAAAVHTITCAGPAPQHRPQAARPHLPPAPAGGVSRSAAPNAEEQVMADIRQVVQLVKQGAINISDIMSKERSSLDATEELLTAGVRQGHQSIRELSKMHDVADGDGAVPWFVRRLPGGGMLWRSVVAPVWAVVRQAFLMLLIVSITGTTLMLILSVSKPKKFHGRPSVGVAVPRRDDAAPPPVVKGPAVGAVPPPPPPAPPQEKPKESVPRVPVTSPHPQQPKPSTPLRKQEPAPTQRESQGPRSTPSHQQQHQEEKPVEPLQPPKQSQPQPARAEPAQASPSPQPKPQESTTGRPSQQQQKPPQPPTIPKGPSAPPPQSESAPPQAKAAPAAQTKSPEGRKNPPPQPPQQHQQKKPPAAPQQPTGMDPTPKLQQPLPVQKDLPPTPKQPLAPPHVPAPAPKPQEVRKDPPTPSPQQRPPPASPPPKSGLRHVDAERDL